MAKVVNIITGQSYSALLERIPIRVKHFSKYRAIIADDNILSPGATCNDCMHLKWYGVYGTIDEMYKYCALKSPKGTPPERDPNSPACSRFTLV